MSHFAKVLGGKVIQVIVAEQDFFNTFVDTSPGEWIQTSYNTHGGQHPEGRPLRKNYAGDRKSTRLNSSHVKRSRMPSSA